MAALTAALIATAVAATAATAMSVSNANSQKKAAKTAMNIQETKQKALEDAFYKKEEQNNADETQTNMKTRQNTMKSLAAAEGRNSTILTSPLGVPGDAGTGSKKTVLGN